MNNDKLQRMVENLSEEKFGRTFRHCAYFNKRLRTTGGRYLLKSHDIEINPKQYEHYGEDAIVKIILHELCHYHLHIAGKGYQHKDQDFKRLRVNRLERLDFVTALKAINNGRIMNIIALNVMQNIYVSVKLIRIVCVADIVMEN